MTDRANMNPTRLRPRMVEDWDDERNLGHGWFCYLKDGWTFDPMCDQRARTFETKREAFEELVWPAEKTGTTW